jgi:CheY-like chemotaxis protein
MSFQRAILLADDDENDVYFVRRALKRAGMEDRLFVARDGQEAVNYLNGDSRYSDRKAYPMPALLLLDLKMPRMSGFDVLEWLQKKNHFQELPVVVLSSSNQESDRQKAMELGADEYHVKQQAFQNLVGLVEELRERWLDA